ncbi:hypothetical protein DEJ50_17155 [Streptomyces venezuelae]|uniref:Uncharacterized protein n=1 Tax=Streptomyces venezuelae TaxID=54571 RepID=A0A5P2D812_STRVZ|nr:hypothetical protein [Streptomyces venezuelae]QES49279.1 hypothetical protein DEJ50_17155 [Streptomyces venezuelae]
MGRLWDKFTGTMYPDSGVAPLSSTEVRTALFSVNGPDVPFRVRNALPAEKADLVAEWQVRELKMTLRTRMWLIPENHEVRTLDERWEASTPDSPGKRYGRGPAPHVARRWTYEQGPDGRRQKVETLRFDSRDMRNPLREAVLGAGWTWRGVLSRL